jgi:tetraacyldisaccharide 4'-kinase
MRRSSLEWRLQALWYGGSGAYRLLLPLSWLYCGFGALRRMAYRWGLLRSTALGCAVVVIGNLVAGGSGKTPLVIALARSLQSRGLRVGILCRGYGGRSQHWPVLVRADSDPGEVGDEAVLLAQKTGLPVMAGPRRVDAGKALLGAAACDVLLCDDGLQHYALRRDIEIVVIDAERGYGNGACLPAGPLREPRGRAREADAVVALGEPCAEATTVMHYVGSETCKLQDPEHCYPLDAFAGQAVYAIAGIGYPQRFFRQLLDAGLSLEAHAFDDHHPFTPEDLAFSSRRPVLMTEKDAVKCRRFARSDWWVVPVEVRLDPGFEDWLVATLTAWEP